MFHQSHFFSLQAGGDAGISLQQHNEILPRKHIWPPEDLDNPLWLRAAFFQAECGRLFVADPAGA